MTPRQAAAIVGAAAIVSSINLRALTQSSSLTAPASIEAVFVRSIGVTIDE